MIKIIQKFFNSTEKIDFEENNAFAFANKILELQEKIEILELDNIQLTNALYECENRLQSQIDNIHPVVYNIHEHDNDKHLSDYSLGGK